MDESLIGLIPLRDPHLANKFGRFAHFGVLHPQREYVGSSQHSIMA